VKGKSVGMLVCLFVYRSVYICILRQHAANERLECGDAGLFVYRSVYVYLRQHAAGERQHGGGERQKYGVAGLFVCLQVCVYQDSMHKVKG
jgi:hypothetical protein